MVLVSKVSFNFKIYFLGQFGNIVFVVFGRNFYCDGFLSFKMYVQVQLIDFYGLFFLVYDIVVGFFVEWIVSFLMEEGIQIKMVI